MAIRDGRTEISFTSEFCYIIFVKINCGKSTSQFNKISGMFHAKLVNTQNLNT